MNWGYKIMTIYIIFIAGILFLVFKASSQNQDLVATDYYEQELKFQERIDETARGNALSAKIAVQVRDQSVLVKFPPEMKGVDVTANIHLYCIADKNKDEEKTLETNLAAISFPIQANMHGQYEIKIGWRAHDKSYYYQQKIFIK